MYSSFHQVMNPTDEQRHEMLKNSLKNAGRPEDYDYILHGLSPSADITEVASPGAMHGIKIGIIGGGLAGMSAAYELRKLGAEITILEASNERIGGRVYTFYFDSEGKYHGELGAMRIPISHEATWHYINLFGLNTSPLSPGVPNNILYLHNTRFRAADSIEENLYSKYALSLQERNTSWAILSEYAVNYKLLQLPAEIRAELIRIEQDYSPELIPLMKMSLRENYETLGLSQDAINLISSVNPGYGALLNTSYDEIAKEEYTLDFINPYRIREGNISLPLAFYHSFQSSDPLGCESIEKDSLGAVFYKSDHHVTGIYQSDYRNKIVVKYTNRDGENDAADIFDYVICTIPFSSLRTVEIKPCFSNRKAQALQELNYIDAQKTLFLCSKRFWERNTEYGNIKGGISFTDLPIQSVIYPSDHIPFKDGYTFSAEEAGVLTASYNLAQSAVQLGGMDDSKRYELIRQNVEELHGLPRGFLTSFVERYQTVHWNSEPLFRGAFAYMLPGQKRLFSYELLQPEFNQRLFFAGEHVSAKHGWMQGALSSGKAAAGSLAEYFRMHGRGPEVS